MKLIIARKVLPVSSPPFDNGAVCIDKGLIKDFGPASRLVRKYDKARVLDLRGMLVMPGLVNVHAHLELSYLHGRITTHDGFFDWISRLIELRRSVGTEGLENAASNAVKCAVRSGTTCIGDISATERALPALVSSGLRAVVFLEVIGLDPAAASSAIKGLAKRMKSLGEMLPDRITTGISPHSTYSVSGKLYNMLKHDTSYNSSTIAVHISETNEEVKHIKGKASHVDGYHSKVGWGMHDRNRAGSPIELLIDKGLTKNLLAVHAVHVSASDIKLMKLHGISVGHCPRSNHMLGVGAAPVARMLERGLNVAIGTDSLVSNIDIDMWEEMRFAYLINRLSPETVIHMGTINGARALGLGSLTGSIEQGKAADIIAVRGRAAVSSEPFAPLLYDTSPENVVLNMVGGRVLHKTVDIKV